VEQKIHHRTRILNWVYIGLLEKEYSEWYSLSPVFAIPKKNGIIKRLFDIRKLNIFLRYHLLSIPINGDIIRSMEKFNFVSVLN
jgi:hypothetical protein